MPAYNAAKYIREAIESILRQTYSNFELLVCDDASDDSTYEIAKSYNDKRIVVFRNRTNKKKPETVNWLFTNSTGDIHIDLNTFYDLSIAIGSNGPRAWYVEPAVIKPVINRFFTGSVKLGGAVNFRDVFFNPHGHGTHTECVGHISRDWISVNEELKSYFFLAELISMTEILFDSALFINLFEKLKNKKNPKHTIVFEIFL